MAARIHPPAFLPQTIDLRNLSSVDLEPLLSEATAAWRAELEWDFEKSADLVRRFVDLRALNGAALVENQAVTGYVYYVLEDNKVLLGDLYVRTHFASEDRENRLLEAAVEQAISISHVTRVECQLMMMRTPPQRVMPRANCLRAFERNFMRLDLGRAALHVSKLRRPVLIENWSDHYLDAAARLLAEAYAGHIDGRINDQYRSASGAYRFISNIVQYPGCGTFYRLASYAAFEPATGQLCGISLTSLVAPQSGHITQICVAPRLKASGIGYAMLRQSLLTLREAGCRSASLTVTSANREAISLYERVGFLTVRRFWALVWEGFR